MAFKCRGEHVLGGLYTGIDTRHIVMASKMVFSRKLLQLRLIFLGNRK